MTDRPVVGRFGDAPENPPEDGVVLYDPTPRAPIPDEEFGEERARRPWWMWVLAVAVAAGAVGGYYAYAATPGAQANDDPAELPPLVPSMMGAAGEMEALVPLPGNQLSGAVGDTVDIAIRANGTGGVPLPDTSVAFRIETGEGTLLLGAAPTDQQGIARSGVVLPPLPGVTTVVAEVPGSTAPSATIELIARAGAPSRMTPVQGDGQSADAGQLLQDRLRVRVTDALDNPVPGVPIEFAVRSGEGVNAPSRARTDSLGEASTLWRLGTGLGGQELVASSPVFAGEVVFSASASRPRATTQTTLPPPPAEDIVVPIRRSTFAIGASHVCELLGGVARCRGSSDRGQAAVEAHPGFTQITGGVSHGCGIDDDGVALCWGANESGQLGDGTLTDRDAPVPVRTELRFLSLTAGAAHTCGLAGGGIPACWGLNVSGQLGDGSRNDQRGPRTVGGGLAFRTLTAGWNHTCGLTASGNAFCWGLNTQGQLGDGSRLDRLVPTLVRGAVETLVAGSYHTCGISAGTVLCWGGNAFGQLGDGTTEDQPHPVEVVGLPARPTALAAGAVHTCALVSGGDAFCWGQNLQGQLGDGTNENRARSVPVAGGIRFTEIEAGGAVTCGVATDGGRYCWGLNGSGQLGDGSRISRSRPTRVGG